MYQHPSGSTANLVYRHIDFGFVHMNESAHLWFELLYIPGRDLRVGYKPLVDCWGRGFLAEELFHVVGYVSEANAFEVEVKAAVIASGL